MPRISIILMLAAASALAQIPNQTTAPVVTVKTAASKPATPQAKAKKLVGSSTPVIVIHGLCEGNQPGTAGAKSGSCDTKLSRQQFENLIDVLGATTRGIESASYRAFAESYAGLLVYANAGQKAGVENDARFPLAMNMTRLRALTEMYRVKKVEEVRHISPEEIEAYYKKNIDSYEEVDLDRFVLPKNNQANLDDLEFRAKSERLAKELHERALKGEDFFKLEKEGFDGLGIKNPPSTKAAIRRGQLEDKAEKEIFALDQGQVTALMGTNAVWVFYKRTGRRMLSLEDVRDEIFTWIYRDRIDAMNDMPKTSVHVDYNETYFGPAPGAKAAAGATAKPAQDAQAAEKPSAPAVLSAGDAVLTIHGLCSSQETKTDACATVVTKEQFETVATLSRFLSSSRVSPSPRDIAEGYVTLLVYGNAAEKAGLDKDPRFQQVLELARKRTLTDMYRLKTDEGARQVPDDAIASFYKEHNANFEELQLRYVSIPKETAKQSGDADAAAKKLAAELRERAAQGEDMDKLTREAYEKLGKKDPPPSLMAPIRRGALEENAEREVFALEPGQVSSLREFPPAYVFYKLEKRRMVPLDEAKPQISQFFYRIRLEQQTKALAESVRAEYNEDYFGGLAPSQTPAAAHASSSPHAVSHPAKHSFAATVNPVQP